MPSVCLVPKCKSRGCRDKVGFFKIPTPLQFKHKFELNNLSLQRRIRWMDGLKLDESDHRLKHGRVCSKHFIGDCGNNAQRDNVQFFRIPAELRFKYSNALNELSLKRREKWIVALKRNDLTETKLKNARICAKHFFTGKPANLQDVDHPDWVPSVNMTPALKGIKPRSIESQIRRFERRKEREEISSEIQMPRRCCVPNCKSNYDSYLKSNKYEITFGFPSDENLCKLWLKAINREDLVVTKNTMVCIKHFDDSQLLRTEFYKNKDGNIRQSDLKRPKLIKGSVPCIMPDEPEFFESLNDVRRTEIEDGSGRVFHQEHQAYLEPHVSMETDTNCETPPLLNTRAFRNVCRICLQTQDLFLIDDVQWENVSLRKVLGEWINFKKNYENKMPQNICKSCIKWALNIQYFFSQMRKSENILTNSLVHELSPFLMRLQQQPKEEMLIIYEVKEESETDDINDSYVDDDNNFPSDDNSKNGVKLEKIQKTASPVAGTSTEEPILTNLNTSSNAYTTKLPAMFPLKVQSQHDKKQKLIEEINKDKQEIQHIRNVVATTNELAQQQREWQQREKEGKIVSQLDKDFVYFCGTCESGFNKHEELLTHKKIANHYRGRTIFVCPICKLKTQNHARLKEHIQKHRNEKPHVCATCKKAFNAKSDLRRHTRNIHLNQRSLKCHYCYRLFQDPKKLTEHEATHANISYVCSYCGKSFKIHQYWYNHEKFHRQQEFRTKAQNTMGEFQCSDCGKIYQTKYAFEEHGKEHTNNTFSCDVCNKQFSTENKMAKHRDFVHSEARYTCHICGHTVKQKNILERHIQAVHHGIRTTFNCEYCEKVFYNKGSFRLHMKIHTNDTKYQCKTCFRICTTKRALETHLRVHTGERTHECPQCRKKFASKETLKLHVRTHIGPPTHQCTICSKGFYLNCLLQKHIRQVHNSDKTKTEDKTKLANKGGSNKSLRIAKKSDYDSEATEYESGAEEELESMFYFDDVTNSSGIEPVEN